MYRFVYYRVLKAYYKAFYPWTQKFHALLLTNLHKNYLFKVIFIKFNVLLRPLLINQENNNLNKLSRDGLIFFIHKFVQLFAFIHFLIP